MCGPCRNITSSRRSEFRNHFSHALDLHARPLLPHRWCCPLSPKSLTGQVNSFSLNLPFVMDAIPLLDLKAQYASIRAEVREAIDRVMESQQFILGPEVEALERDVAEYCGCRHAIGVSSGTDALLAVLMALEVRPGDEVITSAYSFLATAGTIARLGAIPVFVDIDRETFNIDPAGIESRITPRTRALLPVHLFGQMSDMEQVLRVASRHKLPVIEDATQAIGAEVGGKRAGGFGMRAVSASIPPRTSEEPVMAG